VSVPLNTDLEAGFGADPETVSQTITLAIDAGAVGGNKEDYSENACSPLYDIDLSVERIKSTRRAITNFGMPFTLIGRTDGMNAGHSANLEQAIQRANLYREACADWFLVRDKNTVTTLVQENDGPINIVMGLSGLDVSFAELEYLAVRAVSIGDSLTRSIG